MNPIEQLQTMRDEAEERLNRYPDYILMKSLETLISSLDPHSHIWEAAPAEASAVMNDTPRAEPTAAEWSEAIAGDGDDALAETAESSMDDSSQSLSEAAAG